MFSLPSQSGPLSSSNLPPSLPISTLFRSQSLVASHRPRPRPHLFSSAILISFTAPPSPLPFASAAPPRRLAVTASVCLSLRLGASPSQPRRLQDRHSLSASPSQPSPLPSASPPSQPRRLDASPTVRPPRYNSLAVTDAPSQTHSRSVHNRPAPNLPVRAAPFESTNESRADSSCDESSSSWLAQLGSACLS